MLKKGYIYKITILNKKSKLCGYTYVGKHNFVGAWLISKSEALKDGYYGSGKLLMEYYNEWGYGYLVKKEILEWIYAWEDTYKIESKHIKKDKTKFLFFKNKKNLNIKD